MLHGKSLRRFKLIPLLRKRNNNKNNQNNFNNYNTYNNSNTINNHIFDEDEYSISENITRENLHYRIKSLLFEKTRITIQTTTFKCSTDFQLYHTYDDFDFKNQNDEKYLTEYSEQILSNLESCIYDYPDKYVQLVCYPTMFNPRYRDIKGYFLVTVHCPYISEEFIN